MITTRIRTIGAVAVLILFLVLALFLACGTAQAQAKYEPGYSRFAVARSVIVIVDNALIRKGPRPDSAELTDCGRGFTAGVVRETRTSFRIISGDIASPEYGYLAKSDVRLLHRPFHLEEKAFYTHDLTSHRISYQNKAGMEFALVEAHLDAWDEIQGGGGSFRQATPRGTVSVRWRRDWAAMSFDETGRSISPEFSSFPMYYLTIDAPKSVSIHLRTQEHGIGAVYINGHWRPFLPERDTSAAPRSLVPQQPYFWGGQMDPGDNENFALDLPGGHTELTLRMTVFWAE